MAGRYPALSWRAVNQTLSRYPCVAHQAILAALPRTAFPTKSESPQKQPCAGNVSCSTSRRHGRGIRSSSPSMKKSSLAQTGRLENDAQLKCLLGEKQIKPSNFDVWRRAERRCRTQREQAADWTHRRSSVSTQQLPRIDRNARLSTDHAAALVRNSPESGYGEEMDDADGWNISTSALDARRSPVNIGHAGHLYGFGGMI